MNTTELKSSQGTATRSVTHQQIADAMGVSRTLVTQALHGTRQLRINVETRREIQRVARELGYQPRNRTTHTIGYVLPVRKLMLEAEVAMLTQVQQELERKGYRLMLADLDTDKPEALQQVLNAKTVDGVICSRWYEGEVETALSGKIPWVLTSDEDGVSDDVDLISVDVPQTLSNVTQYLLEMGHERFCLIVGRSDVKSHRLVKRGVRQALGDSGNRAVRLQVIEVAENREISPLLLKTMRQPHQPTAIIAANPGQALPALFALRTAGYGVPQDVSLVSVFDVPGMAAFNPQLTATTAGGQELARRTVRRLLQRIKEPLLVANQERIPGEIIERESAAPPASGK